MNEDGILQEYHRRISEIFLAAGQTPFRICKQIWALHAEMERRLTLVAGDGARPCCKVCGTTDHHIDASGNIIQNPPRA